MLYRYAFISDIHANSLALSAVLDDIARRDIKSVYNLGDSLFGPLDVHGTFELLSSHNICHIMGNGDRELLLPPDGSINTMNQIRQSLTATEREWLKHLPYCIQTDHFLAFHGSPESDEKYLFERLTDAGVHLKNHDELAESLAGTSSPVIICGHSHLPRVGKLSSGTLVINAGSVGLPAYQDILPVKHKMESRSPHAKYAILDIQNGYKVDIIHVPYDWKAAADQARSQNRHDWAYSLETGFVIS
ncbi:metallophosphatase family protein [Deltaproteobacteria bacterium OttesenSCG-928-K17]|nr:metallophosphatase family protein [Deltaproteobacteria bacterium OttesenSCG-928-K17]